MSNYKNLFVVIDPTSESQPALERAALIARKNKGSITAFSAIYKPVEEMTDSSSRKTGKKAEMKAWENSVKEMTAPLRASGLRIRNVQYWTQDWYAAVSRGALREGADLVIKSTFRHGKLQRLLHSTSDFVIMRHSPAPVLLVRERKTFNGEVILAALDLESSSSGHVSINNLIMKNARQMATLTGLPLHVVAAVSSKKADLGHLLVGVEMQEGGRDATIAHSFGIDAANLHILRGTAKKVIPELANSLKAEIAVMGVTTNNGIEGVLIGTTARKVIDTLECDVLTVH